MVAAGVVAVVGVVSAVGMVVLVVAALVGRTEAAARMGVLVVVEVVGVDGRRWWWRR